MEKQIVYNYIKIIFMIALVIALGMLAVNQTMGYFYKAKFLVTPCQLCEQLNPNTTCGFKQPPLQINLTGEFVMPKP